MTPRRPEFALACRLLVALAGLCTNGYAKPQELQGSDPPATSRAKASVKDLEKDPKLNQTDDAYESVIENKNSLGVPFLKNLVSDQKAIWTSPLRLRWADGTWLFPVAAATGGFFATDRAVPPALSGDPKKLNRYSNFSNYGVYAMVGAGGGLYLWSKLSHDDHQRETGILAGEAAVNGFGVDTTSSTPLEESAPTKARDSVPSFSVASRFLRTIRQ